MGLDWIAQARADGTKPEETLGMRRLSRDDPETIEEFRKIVDSYRAAVAARGAKPGNPFHDYWMRDFEKILDEELAQEGGPKFIASTAKVQQPEGVSGSFVCSESSSFRGKMISFTGVSEDDASDAYGGDDPDDQYVMSPKYALAYADRLQKYVDDPSLLKSRDNWGGNPTNREEDIEILKQAITYLRFWGERDHPIWCWS